MMGCRVSVKVDAKGKSPPKDTNIKKKENKGTNVTVDPRNNAMLSSPDTSSEITSDFDFTMTSPDGEVYDKKGIQII